MGRLRSRRRLGSLHHVTENLSETSPPFKGFPGASGERLIEPGRATRNGPRPSYAKTRSEATDGRVLTWGPSERWWLGREKRTAWGGESRDRTRADRRSRRGTGILRRRAPQVEGNRRRLARTSRGPAVTPPVGCNAVRARPAVPHSRCPGADRRAAAAARPPADGYLHLGGGGTGYNGW